MTDRELLELAAKAAGMEESLTFNVWWPLEDDGDALRLAVKLNLTVRLGNVVTPKHGGFDSGLLKTKQDPYAATRRAIVRAAAQIGKGQA